MTTPANRICSKCGFANVPGEQFCASCGTFLEWVEVDADPVVPAATTTTTPTTTPASTVVTPPPIQDLAPSTDLSDVPQVTTAPPGTLVRCPVCGIANPADRTFCQACGGKLLESSRVATATPEQIAQAVAATSQGPVVQQRSARDTPEDEGSSGGILKWLLLLGLVGVVVGVVAVVGMNFLKGSAQADASGAPPTADPSGASTTPDTSASPTASVAPPAAALLKISGVDASSKVANAKFAPGMVADGNTQSAWKEGAADAAGQSVEVSFDAATVTALQVTNGLTSSEDLFKRNPRLKAIEITVGDRAPISYTLRDSMDEQLIPIDPPVPAATSVRITIVSIFKKGAETDTAALGEIKVLGYVP
jgi:uncharacterized OB-fold protein